MNSIKNTVFEGGRLCLYFLMKVFLIICEEIVSFFSRVPKILGCSVCAFSVFSFITIIMNGAIFQGIKVIAVGILLSIITYFAFMLLLKPFDNIIFNNLEKIRTTHHNINCGIYVGKYKLKLFKVNNLDKMLSLKELLETNILLSGLKLKAKLIFDDNNSLDYKNILSKGLCVGNALCFSPNTDINYDIEQNKEFVIENDAFIKEFDKFCKNETNNLQDQISFLKMNKKRITKEIK